MSSALESFTEHARSRVDKVLAAAMDATHAAIRDTTPTDDTLLSSMRYSLLSGGKRFRPCLAYAAALATDSQTILSIDNMNKATDTVASALEMVHAYSLIHDDLPAMDNDDLRRGQATCHIAFDEATAILAGDALQSLAFEQLTHIDSLTPNQVLQLVALLAKAIGPAGMVLGQSIDLNATGKHLQVEQLQTMHRRKTGDLIVASVEMGARSTGCTDAKILSALTNYGKHLGLAFQIQDDLLDSESDTHTLGKSSGADQRLQKSTYTSVLGIDGARQALSQAHQQSLSAISNLGSKADLLRDIADHTVKRKF